MSRHAHRSRLNGADLCGKKLWLERPPGAAPRTADRPLGADRGRLCRSAGRSGRGAFSTVIRPTCRRSPQAAREEGSYCLPARGVSAGTSRSAERQEALDPCRANNWSWSPGPDPPDNALARRAATAPSYLPRHGEISQACPDLVLHTAPRRARGSGAVIGDVGGGERSCTRAGRVLGGAIAPLSPAAARTLQHLGERRTGIHRQSRRRRGVVKFCEVRASTR